MKTFLVVSVFAYSSVKGFRPSLRRPLSLDVKRNAINFDSFYEDLGYKPLSAPSVLTPLAVEPKTIASSAESPSQLNDELVLTQPEQVASLVNGSIVDKTVNGKEMEYVESSVNGASSGKEPPDVMAAIGAVEAQMLNGNAAVAATKGVVEDQTKHSEAPEVVAAVNGVQAQTVNGSEPAVAAATNGVQAQIMNGSELTTMTAINGMIEAQSADGKEDDAMLVVNGVAEAQTVSVSGEGPEHIDSSVNGVGAQAVNGKESASKPAVNGIVEEQTLNRKELVATLKINGQDPVALAATLDPVQSSVSVEPDGFRGLDDSDFYYNPLARRPSVNAEKPTLPEAVFNGQSTGDPMKREQPSAKAVEADTAQPTKVISIELNGQSLETVSEVTSTLEITKPDSTPTVELPILEPDATEIEDTPPINTESETMDDQVKHTDAVAEAKISIDDSGIVNNKEHTIPDGKLQKIEILSNALETTCIPKVSARRAMRGKSTPGDEPNWNNVQANNEDWRQIKILYRAFVHHMIRKVKGMGKK